MEKSLLLVAKSKNKTSRDVINELNHIFNTKKIGHTGTLDPLATGVLVCLIGKYTKLVDLITSYDKEYIATIKFGIKTDTYDITGNIIKKSDIIPSKEELEKVLSSFVGKYNQEVPIYSSVKVNGKKLYEYARNNEKITLPKREVNIYNISLLDFNNDEAIIKTKVSKGTYIRSLINDICNKLEVCGTMKSLERTKQGNFALEDCYSLEDIKNGKYRLYNIKEFLDYPVIELDEKTYNLVKNGSKIPNDYKVKNRVIFTYLGEDIAIYKLEDDILRTDIML